MKENSTRKSVPNTSQNRVQVELVVESKISGEDFPGGPVVKTPSFHCRRCGFHPWLGKFPMPQGAVKGKKKSQGSFKWQHPKNALS